MAESDQPITSATRIAALASRLQQVHETIYGHNDKDGTWHDGLVQSAIDTKSSMNKILYAVVFLCATSIVNTLHLGSVQAIFSILSKLVGL
jgi:hypothetical protein